MENQHRQIRGYRELSQAEIDLMNRITEKGGELLDLHQEVVDLLQSQEVVANAQVEDLRPAYHLVAAEPRRWNAMAKTDIQRGIMALVRAVAQPEGV